MSSSSSSLVHPPRRRHSRSEWDQLIHEQRDSGETVETFCRSRGVSASRFYIWKKRLTSSVSESVHGGVRMTSACKPMLVQVGSTISDSSSLEAVLPNGTRLRVPGSLLGMVLPVLISEGS